VREQEFEDYLLKDENIVSKVKAVRSRVNKARMIEKHFSISLDHIIADDHRMYDALIRIKAEMNDINGNLSNALRKYYLFANGVLFPTLSDYKGGRI